MFFFGGVSINHSFWWNRIFHSHMQHESFWCIFASLRSFPHHRWHGSGRHHMVQAWVLWKYGPQNGVFNWEKRRIKQVADVSLLEGKLWVKLDDKKTPMVLWNLAVVKAHLFAGSTIVTHLHWKQTAGTWIWYESNLHFWESEGFRFRGAWSYPQELIQRIDFEASLEMCGKTLAVPNPVKADLEVILLLRGEAKAVSIVDVEAAVGLWWCLTAVEIDIPKNSNDGTLQQPLFASDVFFPFECSLSFRFQLIPAHSFSGVHYASVLHQRLMIIPS